MEQISIAIEHWAAEKFNRHCVRNRDSDRTAPRCSIPTYTLGRISFSRM